MQTTAFRNQDAKGNLLPDDRDLPTKAKNLLMRTKGWSASLTAGYVATLEPDEVAAFAKLEDAPSLRGDEVSQLIDEIEDRFAAEEALKKQQDEAAKKTEPEEPAAAEAE